MRSRCSVVFVLLAACTQSIEVGRDGSLSDAAASPTDGSPFMDGAMPRDASPSTDGEVPDAHTADASAHDLCHLRPESGNCAAHFERYAFNSKTQACEVFIYGGCGGNANNFEKATDCLAACVTGSDAGPQKAACKVGDRVFASGATGIKDPHSCNTCRCEDGQLGCSKIGCPEECPPDSKPSVGCEACGPFDNCEVVEHGCFPVCDTEQDCQSTGYAVCSDNVCKNVCG